MTAHLTDLIDTIIATDPYPASWMYLPDDEDGPRFDCSPVNGGTCYRLEVSDEDGNTAVVDLDIDQLLTVHQKLTLQLAVIARQRQA
jgi:hypothetical protein